MRRLFAGGGIAIAACACLLLCSGAAVAKEAGGDTISVSGVVTGTTAGGTNVKFTATGSPFKAISFSGGSNWHFSAVSGAAWTCGLTPTNGGAYCSSTTAATSYAINATISGPAPTAVSGEVAYGDASTGTFSAPLTAAPKECHCSKMSAEFTDFRQEEGHHGYVLLFALKWRLDCTSGTQSLCQGIVEVPHLKKPLPHGVHLRFPPESPNVTLVIGQHSKVTAILIHCHPRKGTCVDTTGEQRFELIGPPERRADLEMSFEIGLTCFTPSGTKSHNEKLTVKLNAKGGLDRSHSHLGRLS